MELVILTDQTNRTRRKLRFSAFQKCMNLGVADRVFISKNQSGRSPLNINSTVLSYRLSSKKYFEIEKFVTVPPVVLRQNRPICVFHRPREKEKNITWSRCFLFFPRHFEKTSTVYLLTYNMNWYVSGTYFTSVCGQKFGHTPGR